jgi:hypothetical protein
MPPKWLVITVVVWLAVSVFLNVYLALAMR